jgi:hypothetical protein
MNFDLDEHQQMVVITRALAERAGSPEVRGHIRAPWPGPEVRG